MTTQKMLSTITLFALPLLPCLAVASQPTAPVVVAAAAPPAATVETGDAAELKAPEATLVRRSIAVGFAEAAPLHAALRKKLAASPSSRYAVRDTQQIPATATGLFVSGFVSNLKPEHGWMNCHARYFVVSQPSLAALQVESVAASVPVMQVQIFKDRPEVTQLAEESCLDKLAAGIADRLEQLPR
jgi:hypothetical protein